VRREGRQQSELAAANAQPTASLFRPGAAGLFRDNRAYHKGDILTIRVAVNDSASLSNATNRTRSGSESASLASLLGLDKLIDRVLPGDTPSASVGGNSKSGSTGSGSINRAESIKLTLAAVVTDVAPNGNLLIRGRQEMRVNNELRELVITGLVRPQDIARDNSVTHTQIAETRVLYGGRGQLTSAQQARWGQQIYDALFPF
jgi:flagellar L-ring protein precursor FlgH